MTDQEKRVRIAEALDLEIMGDGSLSPEGILMVRKSKMHCRKELTDFRPQSNWLRNLDAMHEAIEFIRAKDPEIYWRYIRKLDWLVGNENVKVGADVRSPCDATASQRAEALLLVLEARP